MSLEDLRNTIDAIDEQIIGLIVQRVGIAHTIGSEKKQGNRQIEDRNREQLVLHKMRTRAVQQNLDPQDIENIYTQIIHLCRKAQNL